MDTKNDGIRFTQNISSLTWSKAYIKNSELITNGFNHEKIISGVAHLSENKLMWLHS